MRPDAQQAVPPAAAAVDGSPTSPPPADRFPGIVPVRRPRSAHGMPGPRTGDVATARVPAVPGRTPPPVG
ncbi:hypothetical protein DDQ41_16885 [Streptomyces spongiicola]|uniref:Uncharacterized protein n=1 Tax=Streptomyces spongiicola TaxID=1690221 RepID=A0ABN5KQ45_9ACTN|nr:hypothetical protein DDQ41_16885 [Streptomyces spongiicola]